MGGKAEGRLYWKEPLHSLGVELERDFGLTDIVVTCLDQVEPGPGDGIAVQTASVGGIGRLRRGARTGHSRSGGRHGGDGAGKGQGGGNVRGTIGSMM